MHFKRASSLYIYIGIFTLCFTPHLDAASWTERVSSLAQQVWRALPSTEQVTKAVNPWNWNMTREQQRNLLLMGAIGALGTGAGAYAYSKYARSEASPSNNDEQQAKKLIQLFYEKRSVFTKSNSSLEKINIFKNIWLIRQELTNILKAKSISDFFAQNTLKTSLTIINNFLRNNITHLDITASNAYAELLILDPLDTNDIIINQDFLNKIEEIQTLLQKKKNAARYYGYIESRSKVKYLKQNIEDSDRVLVDDIPILTSFYSQQFKVPLTPEQSVSPLSNIPTEEPIKDITPTKSDSDAPSLSTPTQVPTSPDSHTAVPQDIPTKKEPAVSITSAPAQKAPQSTHTQTTPQPDPFKRPILSKDPHNLRIINDMREQLITFSGDKEQKQQMLDFFVQKEAAAGLSNELNNINNPKDLQTFPLILKHATLLDEDRERLEAEMNEKRRQFVPTILTATSQFQQPAIIPIAGASTPTAQAPISTEPTTTSDEPIAIQKATQETPSLASVSAPATDAEKRTSRITVKSSLIPAIKQAKTLEDLVRIHEQFEEYRYALEQKDIDAFQTVYDEKYQELTNKPKNQPQAAAQISTQPTQTNIPPQDKKPFSTEILPSFPDKPSSPTPVSPITQDPVPVVTDTQPLAQIKELTEKEKEKEEEEKPISMMDQFIKADAAQIASAAANLSTPIIIKNNTSTSIELKGSYKRANGTIKEIKDPIRIEKNGFVNLADAKHLNLQYYQPGGWFSYYITESLDYGPNTITLQNRNLGGYTYTITNYIKDNPHTLLQVDPKAPYQTVQEALKKTDINPDYVKTASYYTWAGFGNVGKRIYDTLSTSPAMPIVKNNKGVITSIGDPYIIWNDLQDIVLDLQNTLKLTKHALDEYMKKALVVYLYHVAHQSGHTFDEGTFVLHDNPQQNTLHPASAIFTFLSSMAPDLRYASHFNGLARLDPEKYAQLATTAKNFYELKVDLTKESQLWGDEEPKTVILFNWLTAKKRSVGDDVHYIPTSMFIKPERNGTQGWIEWLLHAGDYVRTQWNKWNGSDTDDQPKYSKERVPVILLKEYETLVNATMENITPETINFLAQDKPKVFTRQLKTWHPDLASNNKTLFNSIQKKEQLNQEQEKTMATFKVALYNSLSSPAIKKMLLRYNTRDGWGIQKMKQLTNSKNPPITIQDNDYGPSINKGDDLIVTFAPADALNQFNETLNKLQQQDSAHNTYPEIRYGREVILMPSDESSGSSSSSNQP